MVSKTVKNVIDSVKKMDTVKCRVLTEIRLDAKLGGFYFLA